MPQAGVTGPTAPIAKRAEPKKKKREPDIIHGGTQPVGGGPAAPKPKPEPEAPSTPVERIGRVEKITGARLPSRLSLAVADSGAQGETLDRLALQIVRRTDVTPSYVFGRTQYADYTDPIWGGPIRLQTLQRMSRDGVSDGVITGLLQLYYDPKRDVLRLPSLEKVMQGPIGQRLVEGAILAQERRGQPERLPTGRLEPATMPDMRPSDVAEMWNMIARQNPRLELDQGLAMAVSLVREGGDPDLIGANYEVVDRHYRDTGQYARSLATGGVVPSRRPEDRPRTFADALALAAEAARIGLRFKTGADVAAALLPDLAGRRAAERQAQAEAFREQAAGRTSPGIAATVEEWAALTGQPIQPATETLKALGTQRPGEAAEVAERQFGMVGIDLELVQFRMKNFFRVATELREQMRLEETAWERSWLNEEVIAPAWQFVTDVWEETTGVLTDTLGGLEFWGKKLIGDEKGADAALTHATDQAWRIRSGVKTFADVLYEDYGVPRGLGVATEFLLGFYADPFVLVGKLGQSARLLRTLPQVADKQGLVRRLLKEFGPENMRTALVAADEARLASRGVIYTHLARSFGGKYGDDFLRALSGDDWERQVQLWTRRFRVGRMEERAPFSLPYLLDSGRALRQTHPDLVRGVLTPESSGDGFGTLVAHFTFDAPPDTVASHLLQSHIVQDRLVRQGVDDAVEQLTLDDALRGPADEAVALADEAVGAGTMGPLFDLPLRMEIPTTLKPVPFGGLVDWTASRLPETALGQTGAGRRVSRLFSINPTSAIYYGSAAEVGTSFGRRARRGLLSPARVDFYERTAATAPRTRREPFLDELLEQMDREVISDWARKHNIGDEFVDTALVDIRAAQADAQYTVFGTADPLGQTKLSAGTPITSPILKSELANFRVAADPLEIQRLLNRNLGRQQRLRDAAFRAFGRTPPVAESMGTTRMLIDGWKDFRRFVLGTWKWGAVARPAYVLRVVLLEEQMRFLTSGATLFERMAAQATQGRVGRRLGELLEDEVRFADGTTVRVANTAKYEDDIRAVPGLSQQLVTENFMQGVLHKDRALSKVGGQRWGILEPGAKGHAEAWLHHLNHTFPASDAAIEVLKGVARGLDGDQSLAALRGWTKTAVGRSERASLGIGDDVLDEWLTNVNDMVRGYVADSPALARASLRSAVGLDELQRWPTRKPRVHGPLVEGLLFNRSERTIRGAMEAWYELWVRGPEANINRYPYKNFWKSRAERALTRGAADAGLKPTDELLEAIGRASDDFALAETKAIMFDFTENSRLGEMFGFVAPFIQPYVENLAVWGHLLLRRNPAAFAKVRSLAQVGEESGFIQRDPDTGEMVVPLSWFFFASPMLQLGFGSAGWRLSAPLSSFNLFFQNTMDVPLPFSDASLPIPLPSLSPWVGGAFQRLFAGTNSRALESYLFAYGDAPKNFGEYALSLLPSWIERGVQTVFGSSVYENSWRGSVADFLTLQQFQGEEPNIKKAETQARMMSGFRLLTSMFFPAAPRIEFPFAEIEDEWNTLVERTGDYQEANRIFTEKYGDEYTLIQASKTYWGREIEGLETVRIPPTEFALRLLRQPGFKEFADRHPAWAAGIIVGSQHDDFDFEAWASQVATGDILYKDPQKFLEGAEEIEFWQGIDELDSDYDVQFERLDMKRRQPGTEDYDALRRSQREDMLDLYNRFPGIAKKYMQRVTDEVTGEYIGADWTQPEGKPSVLQALRVAEVMDSPIFSQFPAGKALQEYMDHRGVVAKELSRLGFDSIRASGAEGELRDWERFTTDLVERYPQFEPFMDQYFRYDLGNIVTAGDRAVARLEEQNPERYQIYKNFDDRMDDISNLLPDDDVEEDLKYQRKRNLIEGTPSWVTRLWWKKKSHGERESYVNNLTTLPLVFASRLDLELLLSADPLSGKIDGRISDKAATWWNRGVAVTSLEAERLAAAGQDDKKAYEARTAFVKAHLGKDKDFDKLVKAADTWGWSLDAAGYTTGKDKASWAWRQVVTLARFVQSEARQREVYGVDDFNPESAEWYRGARASVLSYAEQLQGWSDQFKAQWEDIQRRANEGAPLISWLIPDNVFPPLAGG